MSQAAHQTKPKGDKGAAKAKAAPRIEPRARVGSDPGAESDTGTGLSELGVPVYLQAKLAAGALQRAPSPPAEEKLPPGVQAKVDVGPPDDRYEQEADAVAARVQRSPAAPMAVTPLEDQDAALRRKTGAPCTGCAAAQEEQDLPVQAKPIGPSPVAVRDEKDLPVQAKPITPSPAVAQEKKDLPVQTKPAGGRAGPLAAGGGGGAEPQAGGAVVRALRAPGGGQPLDPGVRARVEPALGADLGPVRVHEDAGAAQAAESIQARAFTHGQDIWLGAGESPGDLGLMAHEATHVVQQRDDIRRKPPAGAGAKPGGGPGGGGAPGGTPGGGQGSGGAPAGPGGAGHAAPKSGGGSAGAPSGGAAAPAAGGGGAGATAPGGGGVPAAGGAVAAPAGSGAASGSAPAAPAGGAPGAAAAPAGAAPGGGGPELLMPEPPEGLSAADRERLAATQGQAGDAAAATQAMPSPGETVEGARAAVAEPEAEAAARAAGELTATLGERAAPSPAIEELCTRIKDLIHSRRPPDEESLVQFDPRAAAESAGGELTSNVEGDAQRVQGDYDQLNQEPAATPAPAAQSLETPPTQVETPAVNASQSVPDAVPAEAVSLDADVTASSQRIDDAGMTTEPASLIDDPSNPVVQAREGQAGLATAAARDPVEVMAEQTAARDQAQGQMQGLQQQALQALQASRGAAATAVGGGMVNLGSTESEMRTNAGIQARSIFTEAQTQVTNLLNPLPQTAMRHWETGIAVLSTRVEQQSTEFNNWKRERYEGLGGTALEVVEYFTGLPDWAIDWLNGIEESFGNDVCELMREISTEVNTVIATCEALIDNANTRIAAVFAALPASLQSWAAGEQATFSAQLEGLRERATSTRDDFNHQLTQQAAQAVQTVRESIHAMRQEAQGLLGQIADAIERFADDPARFIINGLLKLVGISPAAFWGLVDRIGQVINDIADNPLNFANNLATALGQGFQRFFDNFGTHILSGFFDWLFSGLGSVGVQIPSDFSLGSLITFFLQLMGITWARIRGILARHIGEENVALLEKAYELIAMLMERGVDGIYEMIKEQLNPRTILDAVLSAAVDFLISALIRAVTPRIIAMFNPAGAIVQAIEVIYRILAWVFQNAARIFSLVETVVNGAAQLIAGNTGGMAAAVEGALARIIAPVIDFLAGFLGLGDLPDRIADTIRGFQEMVLGVIDRVVAWLAQRARALLRALGIGGDEEAEEEEEDLSDHGQLAERIRSDLEDIGAVEGGYDEVRAVKEQQATALQTQYAASLEEGIGLSITLAPRAQDAEDNDIDFEIVIAPNTTRKSGKVALPTNPYKATRGPDGKIRGDFSDFIWAGYPSHSVSPHPVNGRFGHLNGTAVPQPAGSYTVPVGRAYGGAPSTNAWRTLLYAERDQEKARLRAANPSWTPAQVDRAGKQAVEATYAMTWLDLDLRGWEGHHIHPRDWGGGDGASNWQYLKENANGQAGGVPANQHSPFTNWWDNVRKPDIESNVP